MNNKYRSLLFIALIVSVFQIGYCCNTGEKLCNNPNGDYGDICYNTTTHTCCHWDQSDYGRLCDIPNAECCYGASEFYCYNPNTHFCCVNASSDWSSFPMACAHGSECIDTNGWNYTCQSNTQFTCTCHQEDKAVCNNGQYCSCVGSVGNSGYNAQCVSGCPNGTTTNQQLSRCDDIDECAQNTHNCQKGFSCRNTEGSFACDEINECMNNTACPPTFVCNNTVGSYECQVGGTGGCTAGNYYFVPDDTCLECYSSQAPGPYYYDYENRTNVALNKPTSATSVWHRRMYNEGPYTADLATDGASSTFYHSNTSASTPGGSLWWEVNLLNLYNIAQVKITPRQGCCYNQNNGLYVKLLSTNDTLIHSYQLVFAGDAPNYANFSTTVTAAKVRIEKITQSNDDVLHFAEVEVYPPWSSVKLFGGNPNIAINKHASQSSNYEATFPASAAVDHNVATFQHSAIVGHNGTAHWDLNLGVEHTISGLNLVPRKDCCSSRFVNYVITLRNFQNEITATLTAGDRTYNNRTATFNPPINVIHVRVEQTNTDGQGNLYMHIAEFELYGFVANSSDALAQCNTIDTGCPDGYYKNGSTCLDYNECLYPPLNNCSNPSLCRNTPGSYTCGCQPGFDGPNCDDINECANVSVCQEGKKCNNTVGSFSCAGNKHYFLRNKQTGLVATAGAKGANVVVTTQKSFDFADQLWSFVPGEGGFLENLKTGHVIDIKSGSTSAGANVITWDKKPGNNLNQQWSIEGTTSFIRSKIMNANLVIDVKGGTTNPRPLIVWTPKTQTTNQNQRFKLVEYIK